VFEVELVSTYALLHEDVELALIFDIEELLAAIGRVGDVQLQREKESSAIRTGSRVVGSGR
jgi:hypothetical protein